MTKYIVEIAVETDKKVTKKAIENWVNTCLDLSNYGDEVFGGPRGLDVVAMVKRARVRKIDRD